MKYGIINNLFTVNINEEYYENYIMQLARLIEKLYLNDFYTIEGADNFNMNFFSEKIKDEYYYAIELGLEIRPKDPGESKLEEFSEHLKARIQTFENGSDEYIWKSIFQQLPDVFDSNGRFIGEFSIDNFNVRIYEN